MQITKTSDGKQNYPMYSLDGKLLLEDNRQLSKRTEYIYAGGKMVAKRIRTLSSTGSNSGAASTTIIHTDFLGSPVAETNSAGTVTRVERYTPYGEPSDMQLDAGPGFTGHATDVATGLTNMQQRYMDQELGRFLTPDPVGPEEDFINHFNRYNYAMNNPVRYTDPDGRAVNFIIKAGIDFSIEVGIQYLTTVSVDFGDAAYETGKGLLNPLKTLERGRDLARIVKGADKVKDTVSVSKKLHGNDRRNPNAQHNYDILDKNGRVRKNGVGSGSADNGRSTRAEKQLEDGDSYRITDRHSEGPGARGRAYDKEKERAREHYQNLEPMDRHERPKP